MHRFIALLSVTSGCHALLHSTDPLHEQADELVAIHNQHDHAGYGTTSIARLSSETGHDDGFASPLILHSNKSMHVDGVHDGKLCFSTYLNESAVHGQEGAEASAKSRFTSHYAYLYFRDLKEINDKVVWPAYATSQALDVRTGDSATVEGETYVDKHLEERQMQDSIDVSIHLCGAVPTVPADTKWFALALVYPYDKEEHNRVLLWQLVPEQPAAPAEEPTAE